MGPDGAIYIADWYNPIIQHGEVDFRDPRRDKTHGRIWRVTAKGRPLVKFPALRKMSTAALLDLLKSPEQFTRQQVKRVLKERGADQVLPELNVWLSKLSKATGDKFDPAIEHQRLEALWVARSFEVRSWRNRRTRCRSCRGICCCRSRPVCGRRHAERGGQRGAGH